MSNSSVFNIRAKVLKCLQDLQLNDTEYQAGCLRAPTDTHTCTMGLLEPGNILDLRHFNLGNE